MSWETHNYILHIGGVLNKSTLPEIEQINVEIAESIFNDLIQRLATDQKIDSTDQIQLIIVDKNETGAFVLEKDARYAVCVNIGTIRALWNLFSIGLSDPQIIADYPGDEEDSIAQLPITEAILFQPSETYPKTTGNRLELATLFYSWALDYLFHHEVTHINRNHLSFLSVYRTQQLINEIELNHNTYHRELSQMFEIDADIHGLDYMIASHEEFKNIHQLSEDRLRDYFFIELFTYIIIQQLFDLAHQKIADQLKLKHPPPVYRAILWTNAIVETFEHIKPGQRGVIEDEHEKAWYEASKIAQKLGFPEGRWRGDHMNDVDFKGIDLLLEKYLKFEAALNADNVAGGAVNFREYLKSTSPT